MTVTILVLQTFTVQCSPSRGCTNQEATRLAIASSPSQITNTLESEHGVENIKGHHGQATRREGRCRRQPRTHRTGFVNTFFQDLAALIFFIEHDLTRIMRRVALPYRRVNTQLTEHTLHSEGPRLIRYDGHNAFTHLLIFY